MFSISDILLERYEVFGYREGGMGIVYFLTDHVTGRNFAAKTYKPGSIEKTDLIQRFQNELEFSLNIGEHPNVLTVHFIEEIDGQPYLFTDYVDDGEKSSTLAGRIANREIDLKAAISFAYQIARGMEFLNSKGAIAHLDLKPSNILITKDDIVKISDFGLARNVSIFHFHPTTENMGSWPYMSPEQFNQQIVDTRSDVYSFGIIFYEMLTGYKPFRFDQRGKTKDETYEFYKNFHTSHDLGEQFYWQGLPEVPHLDALKETVRDYDDPVNAKSNDLGIIIGGCVDRAPDKRFYKFRGIREALEFAFPTYIDRVKLDQRTERDEFQRGLDLQKIGRHSKALQHFNSALKKQPENTQILLSAAVSLLKVKLYDSAIGFLERAISLEPENIRIKIALADFRKHKEIES